MPRKKATKPRKKTTKPRKTISPKSPVKRKLTEAQKLDRKIAACKKRCERGKRPLTKYNIFVRNYFKNHHKKGIPASVTMTEAAAVYKAAAPPASEAKYIRKR